VHNRTAHRNVPLDDITPAQQKNNAGVM